MVYPDKVGHYTQYRVAGCNIYTLPETNSSHLKMTPWKRRFLLNLLETIIFRCDLLSFREGTWRFIPISKWLGSPLFISIL